MNSFTDTALSSWVGGHDGICEDLRFLHPWRILVQHMLAKIDSQYHTGNIAVRGSLMTLTRADLRHRIKSDEVGNERPEIVSKIKGRRSTSGGRRSSSTRVITTAKKAAQKLLPSRTSLRLGTNSYLDSTVASSSSELSTWDEQRRNSFFLGLEAMMPVKGPPELEESTRQAPSEQSPLGIRGITSDMFSLWDEDHSGTLTCTELEKGFLSLNIPVDARTIRAMILAVDRDGDEMLNEAEFAMVLDRFLTLPEIVCWRVVRIRWEQDEAYHAIVMLKFFNEECRKIVDVKEVVRSVFSASMQDPAVLDSMIFDDHSNQRSAARRKTQMTRYDADAAKLNHVRLGDRLCTIHDHICEFQRVPLHWACANSDNSRAASMVRDLLAAHVAGARVQDHQGRLPLHVACANTSQSAVAMVNLLLHVYPEGAQALDADGNLPLHICLLQNSSKHAHETVKKLLHAFPDAAYIPSGKTRNLAPIFRVFPVEMAFARIGPSSPEIIFWLLCESPELFFMRDSLGCTLFHNICFKIRKASDNLQSMDNSDVQMCPAQILDHPDPSHTFAATPSTI